MVNENKLKDACSLLLNSDMVSEDVKNLIKDSNFVEKNKQIVLNIAKLFFLADEIFLENGYIVARKKIEINNKIEEPKIDVKSVIKVVLTKIKYDTLNANDIEKINELKQFPSYKKLYNLLIKAIDQKGKIQKIKNDNKLNMSINQLENFLRDRK